MTFNTPFVGMLGYPDAVAFMYSRQPVVVTGKPTEVGDVAVRVTCDTNNAQTYTERRGLYQGRAEFDISRIMQLLAPDVDSALESLGNSRTPGRSLAQPFTGAVTYPDTTGTSTQLLSVSLTGMYGTLNQGEIYGEHVQRRLWLNFPQTFNLWGAEPHFITDDAYLYPDVAGNGPCHECDLVSTLKAVGETDTLRRLRAGLPLDDLGLSWAWRIAGGAQEEQTIRNMTLVPDNARPQDGMYLRWINRRGEVSYWLFAASQMRVAAAAAESFRRYYAGDPNAPANGSLRNGMKTNYTETREVILGACGVSLDEFLDLCDLATSPVVERLMPDVTPEDTRVDTVYDGGDALTDSDVIIASQDGAEASVEGGDATTGWSSGRPYVWQRVTVMAGSYARNIRRNTPSRQDFEISIALPEHDTVRL